MRSRIQCNRTVGIVAHVDAGKTTLTERILHATGRVHVLGTVDGGTTTTDHDPRERARGITIGAAAVTFEHRGHQVSLVDTPGHVDFGIEVERSLRVLDGAVVVLDAVSGVEPQTEAVWARAERHGIPRVVFVNKLDRAGADFEGAVRSVEEVLGARALPLVVPSPAGGTLFDLVHLREIEAGSRSSDDTRPLRGDAERFARAARDRIVETLTLIDDHLLGVFVGAGEIDDAALLDALRRATISGRIVPVLAGSAKIGLGVGTLLDAIVDLLPSPADRPRVRSEAGETFASDPDGPLVAFCFKGVHDGFGQRTFVRVYSGTLRKGDSVFAARVGRAVRIGRLARLFGDRVEDLDAIGPGEIAAVLGLPLGTGETLSDRSHPVLLETLAVPAPVVHVAIQPRTAESRSRLGEALRRVLSEDPSLSSSADPETGETLLSGLGELHLEVTLDKLRDDYGVDVRASAPQVAFRETITHQSESEVKHIKRTGGPGQYGHVILRVEPADRGTGISFEDRSEGGVVPRVFVPAVEAGAREAAALGVRAGYPVTDVRITLLGGSSHSHDSNELAFALAARRAFTEAVRSAGPVLLEPVMRVDVTVPDAALGDVLGDLASRRARIDELNSRGLARTIIAHVPLAELIGYVTALRSRTQGRGTASMTLEGYEVAPESIVERAGGRV
ncbi:MAG: elongation factor G [Polyangiaceae bacterium]|nr:elongation factor G [Polyangiaceae bacterium]